MSQPQNISSPLATGGAGTTFEHQVGAVFLALLLTRGVPAIFRDCQVDAVGFQTQRLGWETDDLLVVCSSAQQGQRKLAMQVKRTFQATASSSDCRETFQRFWKDFRNANRFNPACDALVLVTLRSTQTLLEGLGNLLECARNSSNEADFADRLGRKGLYPQKARDCQSIIKSIVEAADSAAPNNRDFWRFLKSVHLLILDLTTSTAQHEGMTKQILAMSSTLANPLEGAEATWPKLIEIAASSAMGGRTLRRNDLPQDLLSSHDAIDPARTRLQDFRDHTRLVLGGIRSSIAGSVTIDRGELRQVATEALAAQRVLILTGPPGGGKSALAKSVVLANQGDHECLSFRGERFAESSIDYVLQGQATGLQLQTLLGVQERVLIHLESVERLLEHSVRDAFADLVRIVEECENVHLLLTCRDYAAVAAVNAFFNRGHLQPAVIAVPPLSDLELDEVARSLPKLAAPYSNPRIKDFLRNPFLLDLAARLDWQGEDDLPADVVAFRRMFWSELVRRDDVVTAGMPDRRQQALIDLAEKRARELRTFVPTNGMDSEALDCLYKDGIVARDDNSFAAPVHDVIEDWAIIRWTELLVATHEWRGVAIAESVGEHPAIRRGFREWVTEALEQDRNRADQLVLSSYADKTIPQHFRDDVLVAMLRSNAVRDFFSRQKDRLLARDGELLVRVMHLLRVACKRSPGWLDHQYVLPSLWFEPDGEAWPAVLELVADNIDDMIATHARLLSGLIEDWSRGVSLSVPMPAGAISVGTIAFRLLDLLAGWQDDAARKQILGVIAKVPRCNAAGFENLINRAMTSADRREPTLDDLAGVLLAGLEGWPSCRDYPELMSQFALSRYCLTDDALNHESEWFPPPMDIDYAFGLSSDSEFDLLPQSALHGPFLPLLRQHPEVGMQLLLSLVNHAAEWYGERRATPDYLESAFRLTLSVPGNGEVVQWANDRLWMAYRGTSVLPNVVHCALMALETWLLELCENGTAVESWLTKLIVDSNNVMTTAVVASVCTAYPASGGTTALALLTARELFPMDLRRMVKEREAAVLSAFPSFDPMHKLYANERERSNGLEHRKHTVETLACRLQFAGKRQEVCEILDSHYSVMPDADERSEDDHHFLLALYRMDTRRWELGEEIAVSNQSSSSSETDEWVGYSIRIKDMDEGLQNYLDDGAQESEQIRISLYLFSWARTEWERRHEDSDSSEWRTNLAQAKDLQQRPQPATNFDDDAVGYVAALCIRDHWDEMAKDDRQWCLKTAILELERENDSSDPIVRLSVHAGKADRPAAYVLPKILTTEPDNPDVLAAVATALTHTSEQVVLWCTEGVGNYLATNHQGLLFRCAGALAMRARLLIEHELRERTAFLERQKRADQARGRLNRQIGKLIAGAKRLFGNSHTEVPRTFSATVREAFLKATIDPQVEIASLDLSTGPARSVVISVSSILASVSDSTLARDFHLRMSQAVVESNAARRRDRNVDWQLKTNVAMVKRVCEFILMLPSAEALLCCQPFLKAVASHPSDVEDFATYLIAQEDLANDGQSCFWDIWNALGDRVIDASWSSSIADRHSKGMSLTDKILFGIPWNEGVRHWNRLEGHEEDVNALMAGLPAAAPILLAYTRFLDGIGSRSLPGAFTNVADLLRKGVPEDLLSNGNTVFYLEAELGRHVHGEPSRLKSDPSLRRDVLYILDQLVEAGSSAAYIMRDDFVTPALVS